MALGVCYLYTFDIWNYTGSVDEFSYLRSLCVGLHQINVNNWNRRSVASKGKVDAHGSLRLLQLTISIEPSQSPNVNWNLISHMKILVLVNHLAISPSVGKGAKGNSLCAIIGGYFFKLKKAIFINDAKESLQEKWSGTSKFDSNFISVDKCQTFLFQIQKALDILKAKKPSTYSPSSAITNQGTKGNSLIVFQRTNPLCAIFSSVVWILTNCFCACQHQPRLKNHFCFKDAENLIAMLPITTVEESLLLQDAENLNDAILLNICPQVTEARAKEISKKPQGDTWVGHWLEDSSIINVITAAASTVYSIAATEVGAKGKYLPSQAGVICLFLTSHGSQLELIKLHEDSCVSQPSSNTVAMVKEAKGNSLCAIIGGKL
ncbi:hypothetical protein E3N88_16470 [Mikania micrantha]|uniref:Uncharacterized protein n=1 Tax=Mikania micrantha TaxID=192012 RepID=A0A5N6NYE6_9ASTR|nr:hypothetical protein E3N88_16470 [Mikania micrantha]